MDACKFRNCVRQGVSPDGNHYYPSFPYSSYSRMKDHDVADLWAFWHTLPAADHSNQAHYVAFPVSIRRFIGVWKTAFLTDDWLPKTDADRGRYLVEALGHCGECHTPRNILGGLKKSMDARRAKPIRKWHYSRYNKLNTILARGVYRRVSFIRIYA